MRTIQHRVRLTSPQKAFVNSAAKYPAIVGGYGSGKTAGGERRAIKLMLLEGGCDIGYYMPTYDLIKLRAMPGIASFCEREGLAYKVNKSDYEIRIEGLGRVIFRSYSNPERIIAYEVAHSIVDELDTLFKPEAAEVWRRVKERNRAPARHESGNTIGNVTTPDQGYSGFSYSRWGKDPESGYELINAPTWSNTFLDDVEGYIESIRAEYEPVLAEALIEGKFVNLTQDKVYHCFDRKKHYSDRVLTNDDTLINVSIDFNVWACCSTVTVLHKNEPHTVEEFKSHDTRDFINRLDKDYKRADRKIVIYPDASGGAQSTNASGSDIDLIRQAGYRVDAPPANPFIRDRINAVNGGFAHDRAFINTDTCPQLTDALESQGYDKLGKPEKFDDHPSIDDWVDSYGYYISRKFPVRKPVLDTGIRLIR